MTDTLFQVIRYEKDSAYDECFLLEVDAIKNAQKYGEVKETQLGGYVYYGKLLYQIWKNGKIVGYLIEIHKKSFTKDGWKDMVEKVE